MTDATASASPVRPASMMIVAPTPPQATSGLTFRQLLSDMNPLQYLPVVGTIYRALTGDVIPEGLRGIGSVVASGLIGGPVGIGTSIASTIAEKLTGFDPEALGRRVMASLGLIHPDAVRPTEIVKASVPGGAAPATGTVVPAATTAGVAAAAAPPATASVAATPSIPAATAPGATITVIAPPARRAWSTGQLAAYGVTKDPDGTLHTATVSGADVLNTMELARLGRNVAGYGEVGAPPDPTFQMLA